MWKIIRSKQDINNFMTLFGGFHDACLKEICYNSGAFVNKDLSMNPVNSERLLYAIFQRQGLGFSQSWMNISFRAKHSGSA